MRFGTMQSMAKRSGLVLKPLFTLHSTRVYNNSHNGKTSIVMLVLQTLDTD